MNTDALSVQCPDCTAPKGDHCQMGQGWPEGTSHAGRHDSARLHAVDHGRCVLCLRPAVRGIRVDGGTPTAWHHHPEDADKCPPLPDPRTHWQDFAEAINAGIEAGVIGVEDFQPPCPHAPPYDDWPDDVGAWECRDCTPPQTTYRPEPASTTDELLAERDALLADGADPDTLVAIAAHCPECTQGKPQNCARQALVGDDLVPCATTFCGCVPYTIRTDYGTGTEHDLDRSGCPIHATEETP